MAAPPNSANAATTDASSTQFHPAPVEEAELRVFACVAETNHSCKKDHVSQLAPRRASNPANPATAVRADTKAKICAPSKGRPMRSRAALRLRNCARHKTRAGGTGRASE